MSFPIAEVTVWAKEDQKASWIDERYMALLGAEGDGDFPGCADSPHTFLGCRTFDF